VEIVPISGNAWNEDVHFDNSGQDVHEIVNFNRVSPGFFRTMNTAIVKGRDFAADNTLNSPAVAIVNESFVHKVLKDAEPLGKIFRVEEGAGKPESPYQIMGVVQDTKYNDMRDDFGPIAYLARSQDKKPDSGVSLVVRSELALEALTGSVEHEVTEINPAIGIQFSVFKTQIRDTMQRERLMASLSGFFGLLAGILATIGLYGVISYMVARRRNEIGIRMALGADRRRVLALIMREAVLLLGIGLAIGTALALASTRAASALLFGLKPHDPVTLALAAGALAAVAAAASYLPAVRAARIHPTEALREE
jgi:predicted permease